MSQPPFVPDVASIGKELYGAAAGSVALTFVTGLASVAKLPPPLAFAMAAVATVTAMAVLVRERSAAEAMGLFDYFLFPFEARAALASQYLLVSIPFFVLYVILVAVVTWQPANWAAALPIAGFSFYLNRGVWQYAKVRGYRRERDRIYSEASPEWKERLGNLDVFSEEAEKARKASGDEQDAQLALVRAETWRAIDRGEPNAPPGHVGKLERSRFWTSIGEQELLLYLPQGTEAETIRHLASEISSLGIGATRRKVAIPEYRDDLSVEARIALDHAGWVVDEARLMTQAELQLKTWGPGGRPSP